MKYDYHQYCQYCIHPELHWTWIRTEDQSEVCACCAEMTTPANQHGAVKHGSEHIASLSWRIKISSGCSEFRVAAKQSVSYWGYKSNIVLNYFEWMSVTPLGMISYVG